MEQRHPVDIVIDLCQHHQVSAAWVFGCTLAAVGMYRATFGTPESPDDHDLAGLALIMSEVQGLASATNTPKVPRSILEYILVAVDSERRRFEHNARNRREKRGEPDDYLERSAKALEVGCLILRDLLNRNDNYDLLVNVEVDRLKKGQDEKDGSQD